MQDGSGVPGSDDPPPLPDLEGRRPWHEGPDADAPPESWLSLDDDALLHRIQAHGPDDEDEPLLEVVASDRHFFIRQEAAKRVRDRTQLYEYEDDRHIGQILVRHLNRREDLTYLERLSLRGRHVEVRSAAQVQLARVWKKIEAPASTASGVALIEPPAPAQDLAIFDDEPAEEPPPPITSTAAGDTGTVDASLLSWAAYFVVQHAWNHLGTTATRELLLRTRAELMKGRPSLTSYVVTDDAHVNGSFVPGARLPAEAVQQLADWMTSFRRAASEVAPDVRGTCVRGCTSLMADALRQIGFYTACDAAEARPEPRSGNA